MERMISQASLLYFGIVVVLLVNLNGINGLSNHSSKFQLVKLSSYHDIPVSLILDESSQRRVDLTNELSLQYAPVVFWHGMGDTAYGSVNIDRLALQRKYPNMTVLSVQIGSNSMDDGFSSYFGDANYQVDQVCKQIIDNKIIKAYGSFNAIGFSQGGQFLRGLIQRCPLKENGIKVRNYISLGGQHQGVFGLPKCKNFMFCDHIRLMLTYFAYDEKIQHSLIQAEYWHDPTQEQIYRKKSGFLADINNENYINQTYRDNLLGLENMVLVEFEQDRMVVPRESSIFAYYTPGQTRQILPLEESDIYLEDKLGLKVLKEQGRLKKLSVPGDHLQYKMSWFMENIASVYLAV